jgi:phosphohistidine phosphatase
MKKINLIRHAKSSWQDYSLPDIKRPLNERGIKTCDFMARHIYDAGCRFENVFCSSAKRAQSTIEYISYNLKNKNIRWHTVDELYTFDSDNIFRWCSQLDDSLSEILIIGHNPALSDFCNQLGLASIKNIPTCGYVQLVAIKSISWGDIYNGSFKLVNFLRPKKLKNSL